MNKTWVFLGLLAGGEIANARVTQLRHQRDVMINIGSDMGKAVTGLAISIILAFSTIQVDVVKETNLKTEYWRDIPEYLEKDTDKA